MSEDETNIHARENAYKVAVATDWDYLKGVLEEFLEQEVRIFHDRGHTGRRHWGGLDNLAVRAMDNFAHNLEYEMTNNNISYDAAFRRVLTHIITDIFWTGWLIGSRTEGTWTPTEHDCEGAAAHPRAHPHAN
jgi:hypothetical protein